MTDTEGASDRGENRRGGDLETIALPSHIVERIDDRVARTDFETRADYATFVFERVLARVEMDETGDVSAVDGDEVEARLESLGYLE